MADEGVVALVLDGTGKARWLDREQLRRWTPEQGQLWVQLDPAGDGSRRWLAEESGLPAGDQEELLRPAGQTRFEVLEDGTLIIAIRTFDVDSGLSRQMRGWVRPDRLIACSSDRLPALESCLTRLGTGKGPRTVAEILATSVRAAADLDQVTMVALDETVAELEYIAEHDLGQLPPLLREAQQRGIALRRRLAAHRDSLLQLKLNGPAWLMGTRREPWRTALTSCNELVDGTDGLLDRLRNLQHFVQNRLSTVLNDRLYLLTILSAVMLPLSFVTGLLGVNIGGIPAKDSPWGFALLCLLLVGLGSVEYLLLRKLRWVPSAPDRVRSSSRHTEAGRTAILAARTSSSSAPV